MEEKNENSISLSDIFRVIKKNLILEAIIVFLITFIGAIYTFKIVDETYVSRTSVIVIVEGGETPVDDSTIDYTNSLRTIKTFAKLTREDIVLTEVAENNNTTVQALRSMISYSLDDTEYIFTISVVSKDGAYAKKIADEVVVSLIDKTTNGPIAKLQASCYQTSPASQPQYNSPNKLLYLIISFMLGGVIACVVVFCKEFMSNKFKTQEEIESYFSYDIIGFHPDNKNLKKSDIVSLVEPTVRAFEPYNKMIGNIKYSNIEKPNQVIMITSTMSDELKSTTISNLSYCMANNKYKVVLIDLDTRKPIIHKAFNVSKENGLVEYIEGSSKKEDIIKKTDAGVDIITAGKSVLNPTVILESEGLKKLISELKEEYDYVLIDTPPILACNDAVLVSRLCDGVIFNISMNSVKKKDSKNALSELNMVSANIIGLNITKAYVGKRDSYYYYYYSYGYGDKNEEKE